MPFVALVHLDERLCGWSVSDSIVVNYETIEAHGSKNETVNKGNLLLHDGYHLLTLYVLDVAMQKRVTHLQRIALVFAYLNQPLEYEAILVNVLRIGIVWWKLMPETFMEYFSKEFKHHVEAVILHEKGKRVAIRFVEKH